MEVSLIFCDLVKFVFVNKLYLSVLQDLKYSKKSTA